MSDDVYIVTVAYPEGPSTDVFRSLRGATDALVRFFGSAEVNAELRLWLGRLLERDWNEDVVIKKFGNRLVSIRRARVMP